MKYKFVYPKFDSIVEFGIRVGGFGLGNCLFVYSKALIASKEENLLLINPTWINLSPGSILRNENDKRSYFGIFRSFGITGIYKFLLLYCNIFFKIFNKNTKIIRGIDSYFTDLLPFQNLIKENIFSITKDSNYLLENNFANKIAVHVRLGDYDSVKRLEIDWYVYIINTINLKTNFKYEILLFSDGKPSELKDILNIKNVKRAFFGNAMLDILAISECDLIIGSNSTFSAWACFLGQKPAIFCLNYFGNVHVKKDLIACVNIYDPIPDYILNKVI